ncbi:hypothetical protein Tsubulata_030003 [Turnera subulata]|uniref:BZIP domain-containing protein n=1 Tax=Turnera subulata TaxID=218843 RepID=A0A9Q0FAR0_9ROSI|nr:hypothetical protein Tsubulata_030003 [Turnera subulata]
MMGATMDDGEIDCPNQELLSSPQLGDVPSNCSLDSFWNDVFNDTHACTHTHTCNPPGPDFSHTHTCLHVHTKILSTPCEDKVSTDDTAESSEKKSKKRPLGNREAVRKYREKKKARAASLEDEVKTLRMLNQQLMKKLQGQAALEAEIARLKCLLVDIRGRIEGEIGSFPYQKSASNVNMANPNLANAFVMNPCNIQCTDPSRTNMQCNDQVYCLQPGGDGKSGVAVNGQGFSACDFDSLQCLSNQNLVMKDLPDCSHGNTVTSGNSSGTSKRKGGARTRTAG